MTIDEGVIKYQSFWTKAPVPNAALTEELDMWRRPLYEAGLIGEYEAHGVGYGICGRPSYGNRWKFRVVGADQMEPPREDEQYAFLILPSAS